VPSALPGLAGYLVSGNLRKLLEQGIAWSLVDRAPLVHTLFNTVRYTIQLYAGSRERAKKLPLWLSKSLREKVRERDLEREAGRSRLWIAPHRLDSDEAWGAVMETLPNLFPQILSRPEYRFPFLDRDLVDYLFAIPSDQLQRPGRRRSLMRRALRGIVSQEILERPRKAFQIHAPLDALRRADSKLEGIFQDSVLSSAGFVDRDALGRGFRSAIAGNAESMQALYRAIALEIWFRTGPLAVVRLHGAEPSTFPVGLTA
jgi:asparagine synthase (glutamine-hydrolysing)